MSAYPAGYIEQLARPFKRRSRGLREGARSRGHVQASAANLLRARKPRAELSAAADTHSARR
jgi:hypothetical protein